MKYQLYAKNNGAWSVFAQFQETTGDYAQQVSDALLKKSQSGNETLQNAAIVMQGFVLGKYAYAQSYGKLVKRALRHFDEVGLSNDIFASLEELLDEGCEAFALALEGENPAQYPCGEFAVRI